MKVTEWKRLVKPLLPADGRWEFRGSLCYRAPVGLAVAGIDFDQGRDANRVYLMQVGVPLYMPRDSMHWSFCSRIGGSAAYRPGTAEFDNAVLHGFRRIESEDQVIRKVAARDRPRSFALSEGIVYSQALLGDLPAALGSLRAARDPLPEDCLPDLAPELARLAKFEEMALAGDIDAVRATLRSYADATAAAIGLVHE